MSMRRLGIAAATALVLGATTACGPWPIACTTVGYSSTLLVTLAEPRDDVALELCVVEGCTPRPLDGPHPDGDDGIWELRGGDGVDGWAFTVFTAGSVVAYRVVADDGTVVSQGEVEPDWVRVGGSERCGGPSEAEVVVG